jgi:hypothetical protein
MDLYPRLQQLESERVKVVVRNDGYTLLIVKEGSKEKG